MEHHLFQRDTAFSAAPLARHRPRRMARVIDRLLIYRAATRDRRTVRTLKNKLGHKQKVAQGCRLKRLKQTLHSSQKMPAARQRAVLMPSIVRNASGLGEAATGGQGATW